MSDPAFIGAGTKPGMELWRIESLQPVKQPAVTGKFHVGDSYILLTTSQKRAGGALSWAIHFWIGEESSQDEAGVAAYKTIELDDSLGGGPVQHREVQNHESQLFMSYFKETGGIEYLPGGVESGFRKVERDVFPDRLLHVKGKRCVRVNEVPLKVSSLNKGDVFIFDNGFKIFIFNGPTANRAEKAKGLEVALNINADERGGRAQLILVHENPEDPDFWGPLGGYQDPASLPEGPEDDADVPQKATQRRLFKISDASGTLEFTEIPAPDGKLAKSMLDGDDVFLLHSIHNKIFLWIGRKANLNEKKEATAHAMQYIAQNNLPKSTAIERVSQDAETSTFKAEFSMWDPPRAFNMQSKASAAAADVPVDVKALQARKAEEDKPVDDGSGKLQIWVINDFKKVEVDPSQYGEFFGGDSYILLYTYLKNGRTEEYIIYFWLGNESTPDEKGAAALLAVALDDSMGGKPVQVRVTQGKEPAHFRQLFKGKTIIYKGGNSSGFSKSGSTAPVQDDTALFHIKGTNALNTVAVQVAASASSLNSEDSFVLVTEDSVYTWQGSGANEDELTVSTNIATILAGRYKGKSGRLVSTITEHNEPDKFWEALGGKTEYAATAPGEHPPRDARLFSASTATGSFKVEEVDNFDQSDLNDEDVFLLDTYTQLFVWIGSQSTQQEKEKAMEFAQRYIAEADDGRDVDMPVIRIGAGQEPAMFSCHFQGWDAEFTKKRMFVDPYQAKLDAMSASQPKAPEAAPAPSLVRAASLASGASLSPKPTTASTSSASPKPALTSANSFKGPLAPLPPQVKSVAPVVPKSFSTPIAATPVASSSEPPLPSITEVHSLEALVGGIPAGVDPSRKEEYLDAATFQTVFNMDKKAFAAQPKWKKDAAKKAKGLF